MKNFDIFVNENKHFNMLKDFKQFLNENVSFKDRIVTKGQKVPVECISFEGKPVIEIIAESDSEYNDHLETEVFTYTHDGDMKMFAKWNSDSNKWISN